MPKRRAPNPWHVAASARRRASALCALLVCVSGCVGSLRYGDGNPVPTAPMLKPAPASARRLSVAEIRNSIRDLFGVDVSQFDWRTFPAEGSAGLAFTNFAETLTATSTFTEPLQSAAEWAGQAAAAKLATLLPCAAAGADTACAGTFIDTFAPRAYRRPITTDERAGLLDLFTTTRASQDFFTSVATVIEALVQSPSFLYRTELGDHAAPVAALTPYETAAALSYFLWSSIPDQALTDAAANGQLSSVSDLQAQAQRMLADPRAADAAADLFQQLLSSGGTLTKIDPMFNSGVNASMMAEISTFMSQTVWAGDHGFADMFTSSSSYVDKNLAALYGIPAPAGSGLVATTLDPSAHAGFLTMPGFIATFTNATYRSPMTIGHFVRSRLFCQALNPPPNNVPQPPSDPNLDEHQRFEMHESNPSCASCHRLMDPIGYGWSQYDVLGRLAPTDHGVVEDGVGHLTGTDVDGDFTGPVDLGKRLAASAQVQTCFSRAILTWALGRQASTDGTASDAQAFTSAAASGFAAGDIKALFAALAASDAFRFRDTTLVPQGGN